MTLTRKISGALLGFGLMLTPAASAWAQAPAAAPPAAPAQPPAAATPAQAPAVAGKVDPNGKWKFTLEFPGFPGGDGGGDGMKLEVFIVLKADGEKLTGTAHAAELGPEATEILEGTFKDGEVSFKVLAMGNTSHYKGKVEGDEIKGSFKLEIEQLPDGIKMDWLAKRDKGEATPAAAAAGGGDPNGVWNISLDLANFGDMKLDMVLTLKVDGEKLTGKMHSDDRGDSDVLDGAYKNQELTFKIIDPSTNMTVKWKGKVTGDDIKGTMAPDMSALGGLGGAGAENLPAEIPPEMLAQLPTMQFEFAGKRDKDKKPAEPEKK